MSGEYGGFKPPEPVWDIIAERQAERIAFLDGIIENGVSATAEKFNIPLDRARGIFLFHAAEQLMAYVQSEDDEECPLEGTDVEDALGDPLGLKTSHDLTLSEPTDIGWIEDLQDDYDIEISWGDEEDSDDELEFSWSDEEGSKGGISEFDSGLR